MPSHRYDEERWRRFDDEDRWRQEDERDPWSNRGLYNQGYGRDFERRVSDFNREPGYDRSGYRSRMRGHDRWDRDLDAEESLRRGTIYDRSAGLRGNYDLPDEEFFGDRYGRYYEPGGRFSERQGSSRRMRGQGQTGSQYGRGERWDQGYGDYEQGQGWQGNRQTGWQDRWNSTQSGRGGRWDQGYGSYDRGQGSRESGSQRSLVGRGERWDQGYGTGWEEDYDQPVYLTYEEWWIVPGPFEGISPRGYQRSDERIFEEVCERMTQHGRLDASNIQVEVKEGEVILSGEVDNRQAKRMAEDIAESVSGVTDVNNQIRVEQTRQQQKGDQMGRSQQGKQGGETGGQQS